ncbi:MAG TPA: hypothetical protein VFR60_08475 [Sphingomicrobium sp.]|nr:hypothetical protein [Sphingomicrobium sp.]
MNDRHVRRAALIGTLALFASLGGCTTTPTPYQPYRAEGAGGVHGGYSDQRLAPNRFLVRFHGNEFTSRGRVETYLLYRAAELTIANGYDWFVVAGRHTEHDVETYVRQPLLGAYWQPNWRYYRSGVGWDVWYPGYGRPFWADTIDVTTVEAFEVEAEILLEKGTPPSAGQKAIDARRIMAEIGPSIQLPPRQ